VLALALLEFRDGHHYAARRSGALLSLLTFRQARVTASRDPDRPQ